MDRLLPSLRNVQYEGRNHLASALLVSLALHGALLSLHSDTPRTSPRAAPPMEVTLVNASSPTPPRQAQALAQHDLDGGGTATQGLAATPLARTLDDAEDALALAELVRRREALEERRERLLSQLAQARDRVPEAQRTPPDAEDASRNGRDAHDQVMRLLNARIAALQARIAEDNARPQARHVAPATVASDSARYLEAWRARIERIGTRHYPAAARGKIYGSLQLTVYIRRDGQLDHLHFEVPSQHAILNSAARRIVELAAPFPPPPESLTADNELLAITRTWHFTRAGLDTRVP